MWSGSIHVQLSFLGLLIAATFTIYNKNNVTYQGADRMLSQHISCWHFLEESPWILISPHFCHSSFDRSFYKIKTDQWKERGRGREKERGRNLWRITLKSSLCSSLPNLQKQQQQTNKQDIQLFSQYINSAMRREVFFGNLFVLGFFCFISFCICRKMNFL